MQEISFEGTCRGVRVVDNPRDEPTELEFARFEEGVRRGEIDTDHYLWVTGVGIVVSVVCALGIWSSASMGYMWSRQRLTGMIFLAMIVGLASALSFGWVSLRNRSWLRWLWIRKQRQLFGRGEIGARSVLECEVPVVVTLRDDDEAASLSWELRQEDQRVVSVSPTAREGASAGPVQYSVEDSGAVGLEGARGLRYELTRHPKRPGCFSLQVGRHDSGMRGLVMELDSSHLVSDEAADKLETLDREGVRLSAEGASLLLRELRPIAQALGTPLPAALGEERREVVAPPRGAGEHEEIFSKFGELFGDIFSVNHGPAKARRGTDVVRRLALSLECAVEGGRERVAIESYALCSGCQGLGQVSCGDVKKCLSCDGKGSATVKQGFFEATTRCPACRGEGYMVRRPCDGCEGRGYNATPDEVRVTVPPGVDTGVQLRLSGKGLPGRAGRETGDLFLEIEVLPHARVRRDGRNLHCDHEVSGELFREGGESLIEVLGRWEQLLVPSGSKPGDVLCLEGKGAPTRGGGDRGALFVKLTR